jgi:hypothetical protein
VWPQTIGNEKRRSVEERITLVIQVTLSKADNWLMGLHCGRFPKMGGKK